MGCALRAKGTLPQPVGGGKGDLREEEEGIS